MKTDHPIYLFLSAGPEAFRVLTGGHALSGAYHFSSLTIKGLERRLDGIFEPDGHAGPVYVVEFHGQPLAGAWYNLLTKVGLYGEQYPEREVLGIGVLLRERDRPSCPAWANDSEWPLCIVALDRFLPQWLEREPENPFVAVFAPLVIDDDAELRRLAPSLWQRIRQAPIDEQARAALSQVLEFWFFERFRGLSAQEIWAMLKRYLAQRRKGAEQRRRREANKISAVEKKSWSVPYYSITRARNPMLTEYIQAALARSDYKMLDDQTWFAEIPGFDGVWANAATVEACRSELREVLEEWLILKLRDRDPIPTVEGLDLGIAESEAA